MPASRSKQASGAAKESTKKEKAHLRIDEIREAFNLKRDKISLAKSKKHSPAGVRELAEKQGYRYPNKHIIFHCLKGGASKTTLAYNTAFRLSQLGAKVLLVDLDKQANATHSFDLPQPEFVFVDVITGRCAIQDTIKHVSEHLDLLPSSLENARLEMELIHRKKNPASYYEKLFAPVRGSYDIVIIDLPPDLSHNTYLSSIFADVICIPTNPDEYSVHGMKLTLSSIEGIQEEFGKRSQDVWVIWSKYDPREKSSLHFIADIGDVSPARILPTVVRTDVTFKNAQQSAKSVFELGKRSNAREDVDSLARELLGFQEFFGPKGEA